MRWQALRREAARNLLTGASSAAVWFAILTGLGSALVASEAMTVGTIAAAGAEFRAAGGATLVLEAPGRVDGRACEAAGRALPRASAGAVRRVDDLALSALPGTSLPAYESTPEFGAVVGATGDRAGAIVGSEVAETLRVGAADTIQVRDAALPVSATYPYPADGRMPGLGWAAVLPVPPSGAFDACWLVAWPPDASTRDALAATLLPGARSDDAEPPSIRQLNSRLGAEFDGAARFADRVTRFAPLLGGVLGAAAGWAFVRRRRLEFSSALHAGVRRRDALAIVLLEGAVIALLSTAPPAAVACIASSSAPHEDVGTILAASASILIAQAIGWLLGIIVATRSIAESALFAYFKDR